MDKITEQDLANRGVKGLPDVPGLTTEEMQRKLEEIAREILIPKVNELVEGLNNVNSNLVKHKMLVGTTNGGGGIHIQNISGVSLDKVIAITLVGGNLEIYPVILDNGFVVIKTNTGANYINSNVTFNLWYID